MSKHFAKVGLTGIEMQTVLVVTSVENACAWCGIVAQARANAA